MSKQSYRAWRPDLFPESWLEIGALVDDESGLNIRFDHCHGEKSQPILEVVFDSPKAYRAIDEGLRSAQWNQEWRATVELSRSAIYVVESSSFLEVIDALSQGVASALEVVHYFVVSQNLCVDILCDSEPDVRSIDGSASGERR